MKVRMLDSSTGVENDRNIKQAEKLTDPLLSNRDEIIS